MQADGNLVLYFAGADRALWSSGTYGRPGAYAIMQPDGNLVVYDQTRKPLWSSATNGSGSSILKLQNDGNLVIYQSGATNATWASDTPGKF